MGSALVLAAAGGAIGAKSGGGACTSAVTQISNFDVVSDSSKQIMWCAVKSLTCSWRSLQHTRVQVLMLLLPYQEAADS